MRFPIIACMSVMLLLSGCVIGHDTSLASRGTVHFLTLNSTCTGLLVGPCATSWGKMTQTDVTVVLYGDKNVYTANDFVVQGYSGSITGTIAVDRKMKKVMIDLRIDGKPFEFNGSRSYQEKSEPNQSAKPTPASGPRG